MITVKKLVFNAFQENTYVVYDESGECVIIDPGCYTSSEQKELLKFIEQKNLKPVKHLYTHPHIDHILGNAYVYHQFGILPVMHKVALPIYLRSAEHGLIFGIQIDGITEPKEFIDEGDIIKFGNSELEVLYTPGHVDGHVCFVNRVRKFVIAGDVLFRDSIGRTDLPTGNFGILSESIKTKLYTLGDDFTVYPGHGPDTTIGYEKINNLYVSIEK